MSTQTSDTLTPYNPKDDPRYYEAQKALDKAKFALMNSKNSTFIATVCFSLVHLFDNRVPTAGTDAKHIYYNIDFWMKLDRDQQLGLLLHETWHVCFNHCAGISRLAKHKSRLGERHPRLFNIACDYVINNMLVHAGYKLPAEGLIDYQYDDMSAEEVYQKLLDENAGVPNAYHGDLECPTGDPEENQDALDDILVKAQLQSQMAGDDPGSLPGELQVQIDKLTKPKLPWDRLLRKYFNSLCKSDYSFRRPNRRFFPRYHLPSAYSEGLGNVAMAIDMSGSVSDRETSQFIADVTDVLKRLKLKKLSLVQFDVRVHTVNEIYNVQDLNAISFAGRGGTDIEPTLKWAAEQQPDVLVVFTDGGFAPPEIDPQIPVLWVIHNDPTWTAEFGRVIHYTI